MSPALKINRQDPSFSVDQAAAVRMWCGCILVHPLGTPNPTISSTHFYDLEGKLTLDQWVRGPKSSHNWRVLWRISLTKVIFLTGIQPQLQPTEFPSSPIKVMVLGSAVDLLAEATRQKPALIPGQSWLLTIKQHAIEHMYIQCLSAWNPEWPTRMQRPSLLFFSSHLHCLQSLSSSHVSSNILRASSFSFWFSFFHSPSNVPVMHTCTGTDTIQLHCVFP